MQASAVWHTEPEIVAAWGAFGAIFTAIAVAHTLYAPREVVLWNWRRIVLLGISLAIAVGSQFSLIVLAPMALGFLLYVAPVRRQAGLVIWIAACVVGFVLLFAVYFFHPHAFAESMRQAAFWGATWRGFTVLGVYKQVAVQIGRACPALALGLPVALVTYAAWPRTRYFGNTAPLLVAVLFVILGMAHPHVAGAGFLACRHSVSVHLRLGSTGRFAGDALQACGDGLRRGHDGGLRNLEPGQSGAGTARLKPGFVGRSAMTEATSAVRLRASRRRWTARGF